MTAHLVHLSLSLQPTGEARNEKKCDDFLHPPLPDRKLRPGGSRLSRLWEEVGLTFMGKKDRTPTNCHSDLGNLGTLAISWLFMRREEGIL
jgi:hypothetical protein